MSREEKVKDAVSGGYHPGGMTLVAIELAALVDALLAVREDQPRIVATLPPMTLEIMSALVPAATGQDLVPRRLFDCSKGEEVWIRGTVLSERVDNDGEVFVEFHGHGKYVACETQVKSL